MLWSLQWDQDVNRTPMPPGPVTLTIAPQSVQEQKVVGWCSHNPFNIWCFTVIWRCFCGRNIFSTRHLIFLYIWSIFKSKGYIKSCYKLYISFCLLTDAWFLFSSELLPLCLQSDPSLADGEVWWVVRPPLATLPCSLLPSVKISVGGQGWKNGCTLLALFLKRNLPHKASIILKSFSFSGSAVSMEMKLVPNL